MSDGYSQLAAQLSSALDAFKLRLERVSKMDIGSKKRKHFEVSSGAQA